MSLRYRIIIAILVCSVVSAAFVATPLFLGARQMVSAGSEREMTQVKAGIETALSARITEALSMSAFFAGMPRVQRAMPKSDTKGLHRLFVKDFDDLSAQTGITQIQFHTPDNVSVLRVHDPENHGDTLTDTRPIVAEANAQGASIAGLEHSVNGLNIIGVSSVKARKKHAGTVEVALSFDNALLDRITSGTDSSLEVYLLTDDTLPRLTSRFDGDALLTADQIRAAAEEGYTPQPGSFPDLEMVGTTFPILDYAGKPIAIAHVLVPQAAYLAIEQQMLMVGGIATGVALLLSMIMAWVFGKRLTGALEKVIRRMRRLSEGEIDVDTSDLSNQSGEIGAMVSGLESFREGLIEAGDLRRQQEIHQAEQEHVVAVLAQGLGQLASGNMHTRIHEDMGEGYVGLVSDFNRAAEQLSHLVDELTDSASNILSISETIGNAAEDLSARTENSAASLEETAAALQMVTGAVTSSAESAKGANQVGQGAIAKAETGAGIVSETVEAMGEIDKSSEEIARISGIIDDIAFQTNLLALNAGVEAARAGQAGSGFAVVAGEVQALSQRTAEAAGQISQLIANSGERVTQGVALVGRTGSALDEILTTVQDVTTRVGEIANLSQDQSQGLSEVNAAVGQLDQATQQNAAMFQRTSEASQALVKEGARLRDLVGQFNGQPATSEDTIMAQSA